MKAITSFISVLVLSLVFMSFEMPRVISGQVTDEQGNPMIGVTIVEKGTANGAVSDIHGMYHLTVSEKATTLVFSFVGYKSEEVTLGASDQLNVQMDPHIQKIDGMDVVYDMVLSEDECEMEEVVVVGYGHQGIRGRVAGLHATSGKKRARRERSMASPAVLYMNHVQHQPSPNWNTESYSTIHENGFKDVMNNPLSTFSVDVDKASYANVRRYINMGQQPPKDAVRIEEMINYFSYDYPEPSNEHPFSVSTEYSDCPWNTEHKLLHIGLQGKNIEKENLPPSNIVFLLDVSGSMSDYNKLPLLKSAFKLLVNELRPQDRVAIVVYAGAAGVVLESTPGSKKDRIIASLDQLQAGGSTAGGAGLKLAYKIAEQNFIQEGNNRIILATDGDFNIGQSSDAEMERMIEQKREKGVFMTVLGFGMGNYKDSKMETIADKGNGNYAYIDNVQEANKVFVSEFGGTLFTIAKDVKFQIEFNPARVKGYRLVGYENRLLNDEDFNDDTKDAGEIGAGHTVTALYEIIPTGSDEAVADIDPLKYQSERSDKHRERVSDELMTVKLRYKKPDGNKSSLYELPVQGSVQKFERTSTNFRFSAAVAEYGMILRGSKYLVEGDIQSVLQMARAARGEDAEGYRGEFIKMVNTSGSLMAEKH